ncbi:protein PHOSPHATE STARVATION RESPONSE 1-like [Andrographis paniculata]|uniref:protein PHOSPHATE STARVATION RESPONSE 1-like n=1 Tax=Andrographis paniculata TaxID=175694 RepID=UPI0021E7BB48|nr:protein PHOSPHATE STARVATION RESPONSE 1-like [Andrographis paniculata]
MGSNRCTGGSSKERLKWTKELHDSFEKAVNQIGGPERATPKGILRAMAVPGLTIYHVKSHLQKYRMSIFTREEDHIKRKFEKRSLSEMLPNFSATSGAQLNEALLIQMEAQKRLTDQLEVQKSLKMKIEAQGRFLDKLMEEFKSRGPCMKPIRPCSPILSLPSLSEESSDQSNGMGFESDSEELEIMSRDEFQAKKRMKIQDSGVLRRGQSLPMCHPGPPQSLGMFPISNSNNNSNDDDHHHLYGEGEHEMELPWSFCAFQFSLTSGAASQSTLYHHPMN